MKVREPCSVPLVGLACLLAGCAGTGSLVTTPPMDPDKLNAVSVAADPIVDGDASDPQWAGAPALTISLGDGADTRDCETCHSFSSTTTVTLQAVHSGDRLTILARWPDAAASFTRRYAWTYWSGNWLKLNSDQNEDRIAFFFPNGAIGGDDFNTGGCMTKCHVTDKHDGDTCIQECHTASVKRVPGYRDEVYLAAGTADLWQSMACRTMAVQGAVGTDLTIDSFTHEVVGGKITLYGYLDDEWVGQYEDTETGGRFEDSGTTAYVENWISGTTKPKYMETNPTDFADAMFLTQAEIDGGEVVGDPATGVSASDADLYWPAYEALSAVVPEQILRTPSGSMADVTMAATWENGFWTAEISRRLSTGAGDDVLFTPGQMYVFGVAIMDNSGGGRHKPGEKLILILYP
jgi:hypothetical protein